MEKQLSQRFGSGLLIKTGSSTGEANRSTSGNCSGQCAPTNVVQASRVIGSGIRCFGCGETSHWQSDCKKQGKKTLFADTDDCKEEDGYVGEEPVFDGTDTGGEEILEGDTGPVLVFWWMCLMLCANGMNGFAAIFSNPCVPSWERYVVL